MDSFDLPPVSIGRVGPFPSFNGVFRLLGKFVRQSERPKLDLASGIQKHAATEMCGRYE